MASSAHFIDAADAVAAEDAKTAATVAGRSARPHDASTRPSFVPSSPSFEAEVAAAAASQHFVRAATKIQASFRGHKARVEVAEKHGHRHHHHGIPANHFPHAGPLQSEGGPPPPRRRRRNPVFVATTSGSNSSFGCPGSGHTAHTIHFDQSHSLPSALEGVYSQTQWVAINGELDAILRDTYLPLCPAGVMCIIPIAGALSFMCWRARLQEERLQRLETRIDAENTRLQQWGLRWILVSCSHRRCDAGPRLHVRARWQYKKDAITRMSPLAHCYLSAAPCFSACCCWYCCCFLRIRFP